MMASELTPCGALFQAMKKYCGMSHRELAGLILSGQPLADGRSPASRIDDRTWISRFVVHAPVGSLQERYFCDYGVAALRVVGRCKARGAKSMTSEQILRAVSGEGSRLMEQALSACHQDAPLYRNVLNRLVSGDGYTPDERAEMTMVLFVATGCSANVKKATSFVVDYARQVYGGKLTTPPASALRAAAPCIPDADQRALGLLRVEDGYVTGAPHWVLPDSPGVEIGALALGTGDVTDVGPGVSGHHARVWHDGATGRWLVEGLGSSNGTVLVSGVDRACTVVEPPRTHDDAFEPYPVELHPGDELILAQDTTFALIEGTPSNW